VRPHEARFGWARLIPPEESGDASPQSKMAKLHEKAAEPPFLGEKQLGNNQSLAWLNFVWVAELVAVCLEDLHVLI
jgi:hypothetical protein